MRQRLAALWSEERIRAWTNQRVASNLAAGQTPGPAASIGKVHQAGLNQRVQLAAVDLLGLDALAWDVDGDVPEDSDAYYESLPFEVSGMLRSRANTIEGGTTEINKNVLGERVLGLPREPDAWLGKPWSEIPVLTFPWFCVEVAAYRRNFDAETWGDGQRPAVSSASSVCRFPPITCSTTGGARSASSSTNSSGSPSPSGCGKSEPNSTRSAPSASTR